METITSLKNPTVQLLRGLSRRSEREKSGLFLVEGTVMIREALRCGLTLNTALVTSRTAAFGETLPGRVFTVPDNILSAVCDTRSPQGICAAFIMPEPTDETELPSLLVALDGVQDPGNVGTIWRTADAAGFSGILLGAGCADAMSPKVVRSAMGSAFRLKRTETDDLPALLRRLRTRGYIVLCSDLHGNDFYSSSLKSDRAVLVIGSEAHGISPETRSAASELVRLPMRGGAESLNAAVAAGIMMYEMMRLRDPALT